MADCCHLPDYADEACEGCGEVIDRYGNTESDFNACCFPDCGCDGARLCMAPDGANEDAASFNVEGMYNSPDPKARLSFVGAFYEGRFDHAKAIEARRAETGTGSVADESAVAESHSPTSSPDHPSPNYNQEQRP